MAVSTGLAIGGAAGAAVGSSLINANSARRAADTQRKAQQNASTKLRAGRQAALGEIAPYQDFGDQALEPLSALAYGKRLNEDTGAYEDISPEERLSYFQESPDYQFRLQEGKSALEASQAARGGLFSGRAGLEAQQFGQNTASGEYNTYLDRLQSLMTGGQNAATTASNIHIGSGTNLADAAIGRGNIDAQERQNYGGAISGGISQFSQALGFLSGGAGGGAGKQNQQIGGVF